MARRSASAIAALLPLLLVGCTGTQAPDKPVDVAAGILDQFVDDGTMISGFTISETRITVVSGQPPKGRQIYPRPDVEGEAHLEPAHPLWVRGSEFDVPGNVARATEALGACGENWGMVEVQALSQIAVATDTVCEIDGQEEHTVLLGDEELPALPGPTTGETIQQVWGEIEAAGLTAEVARVEFDREADVVRIQFSGNKADRTYEWTRGLEKLDSSVQSHPGSLAGEMDLGALPAVDVAAALDDALASLPNAEQVTRVEVRPTSDGGSAELVLGDVDYNPLATIALG